MKKLLVVLICSSLIFSCGHLTNPAPPKAELTSSKDQRVTCEEIKSEILYLQDQRKNTQSKISAQTGQNIAAAVGGALLLFPVLFLDVTTDKSDAYQSFVYREEYLRKLASERNCPDMPRPNDQKRDGFVPSGGNVATYTPDLKGQDVNAAEPWTGKWEVDWTGPSPTVWIVKQNARTVTLTDQNRFRAIGAVSGDKLEGTYDLNQRDYPFSFSLAPEGMSFEGYATDQQGKRNIRGRKISAGEPSRAAAEPPAQVAGNLLKTAKAGDIEGIQSALRSGEWINQKDDNGDTALMVAAYTGKTEAVECLCQNGADVDAKNPQHVTALIYAAYYNQTEAAKVLLNYKPNTSVKDKYNHTALDYAWQNGNKSLVLLLKEAVTPVKTAGPPEAPDPPPTPIAREPEKDSEAFNPSEPWTGKWTVDGALSFAGIWDLKQNGATVTSTHASYYQATGTVSENQLTGFYEYLRRDFEFSFFMAPDAMSFEGSAADQNGKKLIRGHRVVSGQSSASEKVTPRSVVPSVNRSAPWTGKWKVNQGQWSGIYSMKQNGTAVDSDGSSDYEISAHATDLVIEGSWADRATRLRYPFNATMAPDGLSFSGFIRSASITGTKIE